MRKLQHEAEKDADCCAAGREEDHPKTGGKGKPQFAGSAEHVRLYAQKKGGLPGDQGGADAGDQCRIVHDTHAGNLHRKEGGGHGSAEQCGESGCHAAHQNGFFIFFTEMEEIPDGGPQRSPHLKRRAFPAHRAAEENGDDGGYEDQKGHFQRNGDLRVNAFDDGIRPMIIFIMKRFIQKYDDKAACGKQEKQKTV